jgi:crossover junction endodeoxyribonuclease RuvC
VNTIVIGIDPGLTGAIAVIGDGDFIAAFDMPRARRRAKGEQVNAYELASVLRQIIQGEAYTMVAIEEVASRPGQGVSSMFKFGESAGVVRGVVAALGIPAFWVTPQEWKRDCGLIKSEKVQAISRAIELFPCAADSISRKRDIGRADALLIARWGYRHQIGEKE